MKMARLSPAAHALALALLVALAPALLLSQHISISAPIPEEPRASTPMAWVQEKTVVFGEPEPIIDEEGRLIGLSVEGCDLIAVSGGPMVPVKALVFKLGRGLELRSVHVELSGLKELPLRWEVAPACRPMPASCWSSRTAQVRAGQAERGLVPDSWYEYEAHYGIDPVDMERKTFVIVRVYPVRLSVANEVILWAGEAHVRVEARGSPVPEACQGGAEMLIITSEALLDAAEQLAAYRNSTGVPTVIRTVEWIEAHYVGDDTQERIRNCVRELASELGLSYLLILGDHDVVPARLVYIPDGYEDDVPSGDGTVVETDLYYADLQYTWDETNDGVWGDLASGDQVDGYPDLFVGRIPASTLSEAQTIISKIMEYEARASGSDWFNRTLLIGIDLFTDYEGAEGEILKDHVDNHVPAGAEVVKLYESSGQLTVDNVRSAINSGCGFVNFAGHGSPGAWYLGGDTYFTSYHVSTLSNKFMLPVVVAAACLTGHFAGPDCIGEKFLLNPNGGAVAYLGSTRVAWMYAGAYVVSGLAGKLDILFSQAFFSGLPTLGQIWAQAIEEYVQDYSIWAPDPSSGYYLNWKTVAEYGSPLGDPSLMVGGRPVATYPLRVVCYDADGENPIEGVELELSFMGRPIAMATTISNGSAEFKDLITGLYTLKARYMGIVVAEAQVYVPREEPLVLNCSLFDLNIRCLDAGGEPLVGAFVQLQAQDIAGFLVNGTTGAGGLLRLEDLPPVAYTIAVYWFRPVSARVCTSILQLAGDELTVNLTCRVFDLTVVIKDPWGRPVEDARVEVYTQNGTFVGLFKTGPDGKVVVEDLVEGVYKIKVSAELAEPEELVLTLSRPGLVRTITINRLLSPKELYMAIGGLFLLALVVAAIVVIRRRRRKRYPPWPPFLQYYRYPPPGSY